LVAKQCGLLCCCEDLLWTLSLTSSLWLQLDTVQNQAHYAISGLTSAKEKEMITSLNLQGIPPNAEHH